ncbi:MAG: polyphosphate polymerase domain-containing protein [Lachnospiraceae bacterium]|nr:polyphosphate polymerase domain-containing protein [Lachnospiraceae bacterium]
MSEYREVFQRKEIKYLLNEMQYRELTVFLEDMARIDEYGLSRINNIYYDTPDHRLVRTSMEKPLYKEKLRLRSYGTANDETNAFLEIKKKYAGVVYKRRISGKYKDLYAYLSGVKNDLGTSQIAKEIRAFRQLYGELLPAMSICYDRIALAGTEDKDLRITFDSNIEWNAECSDLRRIPKGNPLLQPGQHLMEIKVSNAFPRKLSEKLSELNIFPTSYSKYGAGYSDMLRRAWAGETRTASTAGNRDREYGRRKGEMAYV